MPDNERIAILEAKIDVANADRHRILRKLDEHAETIDRMGEDVQAIREDISGFRGFFRGVIFTVSSIWILLGAVIAVTWAWFTRE